MDCVSVFGHFVGLALTGLRFNRFRLWNFTVKVTYKIILHVSYGCNKQVIFRSSTRVVLWKRCSRKFRKINFLKKEMFSCEFAKFLRTLFYRTPLVEASAYFHKFTEIRTFCVSETFIWKGLISNRTMILEGGLNLFWLTISYCLYKIRLLQIRPW